MATDHLENLKKSGKSKIHLVSREFSKQFPQIVGKKEAEYINDRPFKIKLDLKEDLRRFHLSLNKLSTKQPRFIVTSFFPSGALECVISICYEFSFIYAPDA